MSIAASIVVCLKAVPDNTKASSDNWMLNPYDEYALETALRLKEQCPESVLTTLSLTVTPNQSAATREVLKKSIALGADHAIELVCHTTEAMPQPGFAAKALAKGLQNHLPEGVPAPTLVLGGVLALDSLSGLTMPMLAQCLNWPFLGSCNQVSAQVVDNNAGWQVHSETLAGLEEHHCQTPVVLSLMKCGYELRSANIKGVMKANKATIPAYDVSAQINSLNGLTLQQVVPNPPRSAGKKLDATTDTASAAAAFVSFLKERALV